ncbi:MAG: DUF5615 family PIN-like protein [Planctomycetota bacterium]
MKFFIDNQLPLQLARHLAASGHDAVHVLEIGMDEADDVAIWKHAAQQERVVISKDEDLFYLAKRIGDRGRLLWVRLGNCRKAALLAAFDSELPDILAAFDSGQRIVELT